jgi:hypothetical protein
VDLAYDCCIVAAGSAQNRYRHVGTIGRYHRDELSFVCDVQRIQSEQFTCSANGFAQRQVFLPKVHTHASVASELIQ